MGRLEKVMGQVAQGDQYCCWCKEFGHTASKHTEERRKEQERKEKKRRRKLASKKARKVKRVRNKRVSYAKDEHEGAASRNALREKKKIDEKIKRMP